MKQDAAPRQICLTFVLVISAFALLLLSSALTQRAVFANSPQGKGGTIKPVPTPTPATKKITAPRSTPNVRVSTRPNRNAKSKADEAAATERTYWETIRDSRDPADFKAYLGKYPDGQFVDLAKNRVRALEAPKPQPTPTPLPTPTSSTRNRPSGSTNETASGSGLTLNDTMSWIKTKLETYAIEVPSDTRHLQVPRVDGCTLAIRGLLSGGAPYRDFTIPLADLDATKIGTSTYDGTNGRKIRLAFRTIESRNSIVVRNHTSNTESQTNYLEIFFDDTEMADRVGKAFVHAVGLCRQREPF